MTESRYKIIQLNQNVHTDQDDSDEEEDVSDNLDDDTVTIVQANDPHDLHFPNKINENSNMQTPTAILTLILIYFTLSIGLTFYQRDFLKVRDHYIKFRNLFICFQFSEYFFLFVSSWSMRRCRCWSVRENRNSISHLRLFFTI